MLYMTYTRTLVSVCVLYATYLYSLIPGRPPAQEAKWVVVACGKPEKGEKK